MPLYVFENAQGAQTEIFLSFDEAPAIGESVEVDGEVWTRVITDFMPAPRRSARVQSVQIQPWHPDAPRHDPVTGEAQFETWAEREEFCRRDPNWQDEAL